MSSGIGRAVLWFLCWPAVGAGQVTAVRTLARPDAEFPEGFTRITSIRELPEGRVLLADGRDKEVQLVDLGAGTARKVGREGNGPGEYGLPIQLFARPGDTTLLADPMNRRFLVIAGDGTPGATVGFPEAGGSLTRAVPNAIDSRGRFYFRLTGRSTPGSLTTASEAYVVRYDLSTQRQDTVAVLQLPRGRTVVTRGMPGGMVREINTKPLAAEDVMAVAPDGRIAVVRAEPYRVEWISPSGQKTEGPVTPFERIRINAAEKEAHLASMTRPGSIMVIGMPGAQAAPMGGAPGSPAPRPMPTLPGEDPSSMEWPNHKPPFLAGAATIAGDGMLWVLRTRAHNDSSPMYDVFDGSGRLVERVVLPKSTRLLGFGAGAVYLARTGEDDLEYLRRYRR